MNELGRYFPYGVVAVAAMLLVVVALPPEAPPDGFHLSQFATLPVSDGGRIKPLDTLARNSLLQISSRQYYYDKDDPEHKKALPAVRWLLDVLTSNDVFNNFAAVGPGAITGKKTQSYVAETQPIFRIENDQVRQVFGLDPRPGFYRYSIDEMRPHIADFEREVARVQNAQDDDDRDDVKFLDLSKHLRLYLTLSQMQTPEMARQVMLTNEEAARENGDKRMLTPLPVFPDSQDPDWRTVGQSLLELQAGRNDSPSLMAFASVLIAWTKHDAAKFNKSVEECRALAASAPGVSIPDLEFEVFYNQFAPFFWCGWLYLTVFVLTATAWLGWSGPLNRAAFGLTLLTLGVHTFALLARMYLQGRPPVTNLYSAAVFIGWAAVICGLILEFVNRDGIGNLVASLTGYVTLLLAQFLAENTSDTIEVMRAVLATNFWLATHVTSVTIGYSATFVAGTLGALFIVRCVAAQLDAWVNSRWPAEDAAAPEGVIGHVVAGARSLLFRAAIDKDSFKSLSDMTYGVVCFAMLFSFLGTVLGGIWGDQSWGRFWGWDPKENGAMLIVIWNALILHARWGGMVKQRGVAVLAVVGNMITAWSFFGTNQLGVGLHAYGFSKELADGLRRFWFLNLPFIGLGLLPLRVWRGGIAASPKFTERPLQRISAGLQAAVSNREI